MRKIFLDILVLFILAIAGWLLFSSFYQKNFSKEDLNTPIPPLSANRESNVNSPDGAITLLMRTIAKLDGRTVYSFFSLDNSKKTQRLIFSKTLSLGQMGIPANTWSPDDKLVFIIDKESGVDNFLVLKASGEEFSTGKFLDVRDLYAKSKNTYKFRDVTGWDDPVLLHVRTFGPNFWFDITTQTFLQLAR